MSSMPENEPLVFHSPSPATAPLSGTGDSPSSSSRGFSLSQENNSQTPFIQGEEVSADPHLGRRKRRKVKTRVFEIPAPEPLRRVNSAARYVQGKGLKLADIPNIAYALDKCTARDPHLELLHRVLFNCVGQASKRKADVRGFNGFVFRTEKEQSLVRGKLLRAHFQLVKKIAYLLDVDPKETKEDTSDAIMCFLDAPKIVEGRGNRQERERLQRKEKKKAERERAARKKAQLIKRQRSTAFDSDSDGDEDLEFAALSWIEFAEARRKKRAVAPLDNKCSTNENAQCDEDAVVSQSSPTTVRS